MNRDVVSGLAKMAILLWTVGIPAYAATYCVSPSGSDAAGSGSATNPWKTLTKAFAMGGGNTYILQNGTYDYDGGTIANPPAGTASEYTVIKAEIDGGAVIDGKGARTPILISGRSYIRIEGIKCRNGDYYVSQVGSDKGGASNIRFLRCAFEGGEKSGSDAYSSTVETTVSDHILYEDCWAYGKGRYKFENYKSSYLTFRRCIARYDATPVYSGNPQAAFATYDVTNSIWENCISLDGQQGSGVDIASFYIPANNTGSDNNKFLGCIALNDRGSGFETDPTVSAVGNLFENCIAWNTDYGININNAATKNTIVNRCTLGANRSRGLTTSGATGTVMKNCLVINNAVGVSGPLSPAYTEWHGNTTNLGGGAVAGSNALYTDPKQLYIVRVEAGSPAAGSADDGGNRGATVLSRYQDGVLTSQKLWPWPNESRIQSDMAFVSNRGFCAAGTTLTKYIWEYRGNALPADIYGTPANIPPTARASASPLSGAAPLVVQYTGSGSDPDGTISSYSWSFGDGANSSAQSPSHTYASAGAYTTTLTVTDNAGAGGSAAVRVSVSSSAAPTCAISGLVRDTLGGALSGVTVTLSGGSSASIPTALDGSYTFAGLSGGRSYTVTPSLSGINFTPAALSTASLAGVWAGANFTGTAPVTYSVGGFVRTPQGSGIGGVTLILSGTVSRSVVSSADGSYVFLQLPGKGKYTVTPSMAGFAFSPVSAQQSALAANAANMNFTGIPVCRIGGTVRDSRGAGVSGVTLTLSGSQAGTLQSGADGSYQFASLTAGGTYTVMPSLGGWIFTPAARTSSSLAADADGQDFSGKRIFSLKGSVKNTAGTGISDATVALSNGASRSVTTGANGAYQFPGIPENSTCTVSTVKSGYAFTPAQRSTGPVTAPVEGLDFMGIYLSAMPPGEMKIIGSAAGRGTINPDRGETARIFFRGSETGRFELKIFTLTGEVVFESAQQDVREGVFDWLPTDMASGVYIAHVRGPGINTKKKIAVLR